jgi:polyisoprenoid-binding protein YceI
MTTSAVGASTWKIDAAHSNAEFAVKHLMVSTVKGRFWNIDGELHIDESQPSDSWVQARIEVASVDTGIEQRDAHLRSDDFFNAEAYPYITFRSKKVEPAGEERWRVVGDLTIRDVTREVVLDTVFDGVSTGFDGKRIAAFTATTSINRKDFGLRYNAVLEGGAIVVGDRVGITLNIEAVEVSAGEPPGA